MSFDDDYNFDPFGFVRRAPRRGPEPDADLMRRDPPYKKAAHPYTYCPFTIWGKPFPNEKCNGSEYTDRLDAWDRTKYAKLASVYYLNQSPFNSHNCKGHLIEAFLRDWYDDPKLQLLRVIEYCNRSTGYPTWRLDFITSKGSE